MKSRMKLPYTYKERVFEIGTKNSNYLKISVSVPIDIEKLHGAGKASFNGLGLVEREKIKFTLQKNLFKLSAGRKTIYRKWRIEFQATEIIFPTREGEHISNIFKLHNFVPYSLSYPGTASAKCIVIFANKSNGFVVGSRPNLDWAEITLTRINNQIYIEVKQLNPELFVIPFTKDWKSALKLYRNLTHTISHKSYRTNLFKKPIFCLQMGIRDFLGNSYINNFLDILPIAEKYKNAVGNGHLIHFFGTSPHGFDNMYLDFSIDKSLGGESSLKELIDKIHSMGLYTSHHFNPRIADARWLEKNPMYKKAIVTHFGDTPWVEFYKNNLFFVMDPQNAAWRKLCLNTIKYLASMGFDFIEIDQIAYQRNLYTKNKGFGRGYQQLINEVAKMKIKFWVEGVSDVFNLPPDCYFQVLPRDRVQLWDTGENRRGYPYGTQFTSFFRTLRPTFPISYQIVTEKAKVHLIEKRLRLAKKMDTQVYDLELGFLDRKYLQRLDKTLKRVHEFIKNEKT